MEQWDLYDRDRHKLDITAVRGQPLPAHTYHLVVHVCVFNHKGEMLIQQRQPFKQGWPNQWDMTVGGSAIMGESSQTAAEREVREEIGLTLDLQAMQPHITNNMNTCFDDVYLLEREIDLSTLTLQYTEVQRVRWASCEEVLKMIGDGRFINYYPSYIQYLFDSRGRYSTLQT